MLIEKRVENISVDLNDIVSKTTLVGIYRNNVLVAREHIESRVINPGDDVSRESKKVQRIAAQAHVPTVVDRHQSQRVYDRAVATRVADPSQRNIEAEAEAKTDLDAKILAYDLFEA